MKKPLFYKLFTGRLVISLVFSSAIAIPLVASQSGGLSFVGDLFSGKSAKAEQNVLNNSQNMALLQATVSPDPGFARGGGDITVLGDGALLPDIGPVGTQADIEDAPASNGQISIYIVHEGDSLGVIANMFGVSVNTIAWANNLKSGVITPGQRLVILPISGVQHTIGEGDTVESIAQKYKSDVGEILTYNGLSEGAGLIPGEVVIIPDGEMTPVSFVTSSSAPDYQDYYLRPLSYEEGYKTQGLHGYNGIDIGAPLGTSIRAAAEGEVIIARFSGWNGGYGIYVVIQHGNGTRTLYSHLSAIGVNEGAYVARGQIIGFVGNTGQSTGPHLHFEVRGAKNPF